MSTTLRHRIAVALLVAASLVALEGCFGRRGRLWRPRYRPGAVVVRPWLGAALVTAAIVGTAAAVTAGHAARYSPQYCSYRTWYGGRWTYYCGDHWAYHEGGVWYAYPPSAPPQAPPPGTPPPPMPSDASTPGAPPSPVQPEPGSAPMPAPPPAVP